MEPRIENLFDLMAEAQYEEAFEIDLHDTTFVRC
jgi:hypothetical protein